MSFILKLNQKKIKEAIYKNDNNLLTFKSSFF